MAFNYSPKIVTDGLVFYLDAANPRSYVSGSSIAYSLVRSGSYSMPVSCSLTNNTQFTGSNGGFFNLNGTNNQILIENTPAQSTGIRLGSGTTPWIVNAWIRTTVTSNSTNGTFPVLSNRSGGPVASNMGLATGGVMKYAHYDGAWKVESGSIAVNNGQWHMLSWVNRNNNTLDMYVDGVFDRNVASAATGDNPVDIIGASFSSYLDADISCLTINIGTIFSQSQILQNFNSLKGRFGF
jgi:hypothetical protein